MKPTFTITVAPDGAYVASLTAEVQTGYCSTAEMDAYRSLMAAASDQVIKVVRAAEQEKRQTRDYKIADLRDATDAARDANWQLQQTISTANALDQEVKMTAIAGALCGIALQAATDESLDALQKLEEATSAAKKVNGSSFGLLRRLGKKG